MQEKSSRNSLRFVLGVLVSHGHVQSTVECSNAGGLAKRTRVQRDVVQFVEKTLLGLLSTTLASSYLESLTLVRR